MTNKDQLLVEHYERCFREHGDNHRGVDWPDEQQAALRYHVMLGLLGAVPGSGSNLLDLGCGTGALLTEIRTRNLQIEYHGLDRGASFIDHCHQKFPNTPFYCRDILVEGLPQTYDYIVMNGLFTEKLTMTYDEMWSFFTAIIRQCASGCRMGLAFNLMSKHVDWEREDLFHVSLDQLMDFLTTEISRDVVIRNDYGLYEYTTYVYFDRSKKN